QRLDLPGDRARSARVRGDLVHLYPRRQPVDGRHERACGRGRGASVLGVYLGLCPHDRSRKAMMRLLCIATLATFAGFAVLSSGCSPNVGNGGGGVGGNGPTPDSGRTNATGGAG